MKSKKKKQIHRHWFDIHDGAEMVVSYLSDAELIQVLKRMVANKVPIYVSAPLSEKREVFCDPRGRV